MVDLKKLFGLSTAKMLEKLSQIESHELREIKPAGRDSKEFSCVKQYFEQCWGDWSRKKCYRESLEKFRKVLNATIRQAKKDEQEAWEEYNKSIEMKERVAGGWKPPEETQKYKDDNGLNNTYNVREKLHIRGRGTVLVIENPKEKGGEGYCKKMPKKDDEIIYDYQKYLVTSVEGFMNNFGVTQGALGLVVRKVE